MQSQVLNLEHLSRLWQIYAKLTKPGLVIFVVFSAYVNYIFGAQGFADSLVWVYLLFGIYLAASGAHCFNQALEHKFDRLMSRTANRPVASGQITPLKAHLFGIILSLLGLSLLYFKVNPITSFVAFSTSVLYVLVYTPLKRKTVWNTWVGAIPGATACLAGFTGLSNGFHWEAFIFPLIIFFWQIPHFLALSWHYREQYLEGKYKMMASYDETGWPTSVMILIHSIALVEVSFLPFMLGRTSLLYLIFSIGLGIWFVFKSAKFMIIREKAYAKSLFLSSNIYLLALFTIFLIDQKIFSS